MPTFCEKSDFEKVKNHLTGTLIATESKINDFKAWERDLNRKIERLTKLVETSVQVEQL